MKKNKRFMCFCMSLLLFCATPAGDYLHVRNTVDAKATVTAFEAVEWVWAVVMAICGVVASNSTDINALSADVTGWAEANHSDNSGWMSAIANLPEIVFAGTFVQTAELVAMTKAYFKSKDGYASDVGITSIPVSGLPYYSKFASDPLVMSLFDFNFSSIDKNTYLVASYMDSANGICYRLVSLNSFSGSYYSGYYHKLYDLTCSRQYIYIDDVIHYYYVSYGLWLSDRMSDSSILFGLNYDALPLSTDSSCSNVIGPFVKDVFFNNTFDIPVESFPSIQERDITDVGPLTMPSSADIAQELYDIFTASATPDSIADALSSSVTVTYGEKTGEGEGEETDKSYPWLPDITGPLTGIKDVLSGLGDMVTSIPGALADIGAGITAIPGQISDFFTIDYAQIDSAVTALQDAFISKFEPVKAITGVFQNASAKLDSDIPVITMKVPPNLSVVCGGDEIIVFDLRGYETYVALFRNLVRCSIWLSFAFYVLSLFNVKFHVG